MLGNFIREFKRVAETEGKKVRGGQE